MQFFCNNIINAYFIGIVMMDRTSCGRFHSRTFLGRFLNVGLNYWCRLVWWMKGQILDFLRRLIGHQNPWSRCMNAEFWEICPTLWMLKMIIIIWRLNKNDAVIFKIIFKLSSWTISLGFHASFLFPLKFDVNWIILLTTLNRNCKTR